MGEVVHMLNFDRVDVNVERINMTIPGIPGGHTSSVGMLHQRCIMISQLQGMISTHFRHGHLQEAVSASMPKTIIMQPSFVPY